MSSPLSKSAALTRSPRARAAHLALLAALSCCAPARSETVASPQPTLSINLVNSDIASAVQAVAAATGRNFIVDPRVKGQITLQFEHPVPPQQVYLALLAQLRLAGYAVVDHGGVLRVVPEADARLQTTPVGVGEATAPIPGSGDQIVTQVFKLRNQSAANLLPVLRPLIAPNNTINVDPGSNSLIVTEYADNLKRLSRIIDGLDQPTSSQVDVIPLRHAVATELAPILDKLVAMQAAAAGPARAPATAAAAVVAAAQSGSAVIIPDAASNALIVRAASAAQLGQIAQMVAKLDRPTAASNVHVVYLKNASASELARSLRAVLAENGGNESAGQAAAKPAAPTAGVAGSANANTATIASGSNSAGSTQDVSFPELPGEEIVTLPQGGAVYADNASNALIINAAPPVFQQLQGVIEQLDQRRPQVYIQALIAEVDANQEAQIGVQWQGAKLSAGGNNALIAGTNFGTAATGNIAALQGAISSGTLGTALASGAVGLSNGLNVGLLHSIGGNVSIGALASLLQTLSGTNILSAPDLTTMNNQEARLLVGQNVPFITGSYVQTGTGTPFQTYQRQDIGLILKIRPQITAGDSVKLDVYQEVSSLDPTTLSNASGPTTTKRSLQTTVLVDDGQTIALGGLMQNSLADTENKVPVLGDIPGLGALFRYKDRQMVKTDLIVFLRPVIVRDADAGQHLSQSRYDGFQQLERDSQPGHSAGMPDLAAPLLPQQPASR